jgi:hypothetical protein
VPDEKCPRRRSNSPRAVPWEFALPWNGVILRQSAVPVRGDRGRGCVCARAVGTGTSHGVGTSVTARTRNASGNSAAGRRRSGRRNGARMTVSKPSTRQRNVNGVSVRAVKVRAGSARKFQRKHRTRSKLRQRVVTQQKFFVDPMCARPGCYEPAPKLGRNQARYCGPGCRQAVQQVLDRERKWVRRGTLQGGCCVKKDRAAPARPPRQPSGTAKVTPPRPPPP